MANATTSAKAGPKIEESFRRIIAILKPALDSVIDPVCLVNTNNELVYTNLAMRSLLGLRNRDMKGKPPVFCDLIKLGCCEPACQVQHTILSEVPIRLDEVPASRGAKKLRMTLKITPVFDPELSGLAGDTAPASARLPVGALIIVRDTSGEVVLQAKYHRLMDLLEQKDSQIQSLNERVVELQDALRRARAQRVA